MEGGIEEGTGEKAVDRTKNRGQGEGGGGKGEASRGKGELIR